MELHTSLKNISRLKTRLWIDGHAKDLSALGEFSALKELWLYRLSKRNILVLAAVDLSKLDTLSVRLASFSDLTGISHFSTTTSLTVWQCSNLRSLEGLESLANLRELTLMQNGPLDSLGPIASLGHLEKLVINGGVFAK